MSIRVKTADASSLLSSINDAIGREEISSWILDEDGDYQLIDNDRAGFGWMKATIVSKGELIVNVIGRKDHEMSTTEYAVLHSQFIEMLLSEFDSEFIQATVTASVDDDDAI